jgi:hypothetical protein
MRAQIAVDSIEPRSRCLSTGHWTAISARRSLGGSKLEEWVALGFGQVLLGRVVDADPVTAQEGDRRPHARAEQPAQEV